MTTTRGPRKRHRYILEVMQRLKERYPKVRLLALPTGRADAPGYAFTIEPGPDEEIIVEENLPLTSASEGIKKATSIAVTVGSCACPWGVSIGHA